MTANEIKKSIAEREGCPIDDIRCFKCKHWGYNYGLAMNDRGESRCKKRKSRTWSAQFCRGFSKKAIDK